ncbi:MAG: hypothetical protein PHD32_04360 [Eubacteriales bacterium]|nr:hypothetical protein [Eubacteriales bacterium]
MRLRRQYEIRFALRCAVAAAGAALYVFSPGQLVPGGSGLRFVHLLWALWMANLAADVLPVPARPKGSRKMFARYAVPTPYDPAALRRWKKQQDRRAWVMMTLWLAGNGVFFALYFLRVLGAREMVMLLLLYYVGDYICILWWCPFQRIVMKNRCCATCRIFRWDAFFLVTPLAVVPGWLTQSLFWTGAAVSLLWEWRLARHPEWFWEGANAALTCAGCAEGLCRGAKKKGTHEKTHFSGA